MAEGKHSLFEVGAEKDLISNGDSSRVDTPGKEFIAPPDVNSDPILKKKQFTKFS